MAAAALGFGSGERDTAREGEEGRGERGARGLLILARALAGLGGDEELGEEERATDAVLSRSLQSPGKKMTRTFC
jgi:hypothetical protein